MTSSQQFASSPLETSSGRRRKSQFTFKHFSLLGASSTTCPLRVIAHIDLDAFYAQCEMVRLGVAEDQPLAVQQWSGLIAVNYPARSFGITRFIPITEAKQKCPDLIMQHVATWKEGEDMWAYREDSFTNMSSQKVSLDPYRLQSRSILATIKDILPAAPIQKVEKASIDEVFLDLSAQIHGIMLERYPELSGPPPYNDATEKLPFPSTTALDWSADALVDLDTSHTEEDAPDWDDIAILIGSEIVRTVRASIREKLKYTCSAGVAKNKMLAKLGSAYKKPNSQTVVRNRAVQHFLGGFKFTDIRMLGGKLGDEVVSMFNTDAVKDLLDIPLEQLKRLGDDTGTWLFKTIRGEDSSEVNSRTQIKSMLSAKSFRPSINTFESAIRWIRIFVADIYSRLVEEGVTENKRRPKTINLHHRQGGQMRSRQAPIPQGRTITNALLFELAKNLLAQIIVDGRAWPCSNLSLSVGGFEDGVSGNHGIGGFLLRGEDVKALQPASRLGDESIESLEENAFLPENVRAVEEKASVKSGIGGFLLRGAQAKAVQVTARLNTGSPPHSENGPPVKRRRADAPTINHFFARHESSGAGEHESVDFDELPSAQRELVQDDSDVHDPSIPAEQKINNHFDTGSSALRSTSSAEVEPGMDLEARGAMNSGDAPSTFICDRCQKSLLHDQKEEHEDWHFARDLQEQDRAQAVASERSRALPMQAGRARKPSRGRGGSASGGAGASGTGDRVEKGQSRLAFGR